MSRNIQHARARRRPLPFVTILIAAIIASLLVVVGWSFIPTEPASANPVARVQNMRSLPLTLRTDAGTFLTLPGGAISGGGIGYVAVLPGQCVLLPARDTASVCAGGSIVYRVVYGGVNLAYRTK